VFYNNLPDKNMRRREFIKQTTAAVSTTAVSAKRIIGAN